MRKTSGVYNNMSYFYFGNGFAYLDVGFDALEVKLSPPLFDSFINYYMDVEV